MTTLQLTNVSKSFVMHLQGGIRLPVLSGLDISVDAGECVALSGPSGAGKSSVLKMIYGTYRCDGGSILVQHNGCITDVVTAEPRAILSLRHGAIAYVTQFLRAVPRVPAIDVVLHAIPGGAEAARATAKAMLQRLRIPERLWHLPPATFSGGEQQRINIARGMLTDMPLLLLDEPTASLDAHNREAVIDLILEKKRRGIAVFAIVHDEDVRNRIADRSVDIAQFSQAKGSYAQ